MTAAHQPPGPLPSTRDRLLLAFANLASYGIAAHPAHGTNPHTTRIQLHAEILTRDPRASGSYIFWTAPDDQAFDHAGELRHPLTLHHSGDEVARATHAALALVGLQATATRPLSTLSIAGSQARVCPEPKLSAKAFRTQS